MASSSHRARARLRTTPLAVVTGLVAAVVMALTMSGTLSAFSASITNTGNGAASGTLLMRQEGGPGATCYSNGSTANAAITATNSTSCSTVNTFGTGLLVPDATPAPTPIDITVHNDGTVAARTFTLQKSAACTQGTAGTAGTASGTATDVCAKINVVISSGGSQLFSGSLQTLGDRAAAIDLPSVPAKSSQVLRFTTTLAAGVSNDYQGLTASVPLTWTFAA